MSLQAPRRLCAFQGTARSGRVSRGLVRVGSRVGRPSAAGMVQCEWDPPGRERRL